MKHIILPTMLNEVSKSGIREILASLDDPNLLSLASTITQGFLKNKIDSRDGKEKEI